MSGSLHIRTLFPRASRKRRLCRQTPFVSPISSPAVADQGVGCVFLVPGGGSMYLVDAFGAQPRLTYVANHHEQASSIAAEAYSRINGRLGVALVTTGPGGTNAVTGCAGAWIEFRAVADHIWPGEARRSYWRQRRSPDGAARGRPPSCVPSPNTPPPCSIPPT